MIILEKGKVIQSTDEREGLITLIVEYKDGTNNAAICYKDFAGKIEPGDLVLCNRTAVMLELGTGGYDYVLANLTNPEFCNKKKGHIMKLRYTPLQIAVESVEEESGQFHHLFNKHCTLDGFPVIIGSLHSMVAPAVLGASSINSKLKIVYIMSDGACLPLEFSNTVAKLKKTGLITETITYGHAFGGDYEAVNVYTALLAAKYGMQADLAIVAMGPGIVGTGTFWGHTGIEQGEIANAVGALAGIPIIVSRISFQDNRKRHWGLSHHTLTVLEKICTVRAIVVIPQLPDEKQEVITKKLSQKGITGKYQIVIRDGTNVISLAKEIGITLKTMNRGEDEETEYFATAGAAGIVAAELIAGKVGNIK